MQWYGECKELAKAKSYNLTITKWSLLEIYHSYQLKGGENSIVKEVLYHIILIYKPDLEPLEMDILFLSTAGCLDADLGIGIFASVGVAGVLVSCGMAGLTSLSSVCADDIALRKS